MDNRQANINRFEAEMAKVTRDGVDKLMAFIRKSDMYAAPASTRFHLSVTGGLLQHSLNVLDALRANLTKNDDGTYSYEVAGVPAARVTEENVIIMALLHDICKTYFYTTEIRNRKVGGKWEQYEAFAVDDKIPYGHGEKSVMMIEEYMKLQPVERYAIRWHMGYTEADTLSFNNAIDKYPMIWALHSADTQASHFMEANEGNKLAYADNGSAEYADQPTMDEIYETFIISLWLAGELDAKDFWDNKDKYFEHAWITAPKKWIDPQKEANANKIALNTGQKTFKQIAAEQGRDWKEQIDEMAEVLEYAKDKGIDLGGVIFDQTAAELYEDEETPADNPQQTDGNQTGEETGQESEEGDGAEEEGKTDD